MLFLVRSAFCIAAVVLAIPDPARVPARSDVMLGAGRSALSTLRALCQADPNRCPAFAKQGVGEMLTKVAGPVARPPTRKAFADTLLPMDLRHAWSGPTTPALTGS